MASSIVKSVAQQLGSLLVEEAKYLYGVRRKIESLQMELEWIQCFLKDADTQQHRDEVICKWVSQVRDFAYDAEDIIERYVHEVSHHQRDGIWNTIKWGSSILCTCDAMTLHELGSELDYLTQRMSELTSRLQRYGVQLIRPTRILEYNREERRTYSHTIEDVVGLEKDIQQVVDLLVNTEVKVLAISGIGGLGKSTLARKVLKNKEIKDYFNENRAWVYISREFESKNVFEEILSQLEKGEEAKKRNEENNNAPMRKIEPEGLGGERNKKAKRRAEELPGEISKLLQGKKWLVVFDDIWEVKAWERLKPAFESIFTAGSFSKILITTRNQGLAKEVDPSGYTHLLKTLSDDESWKLLKRKAFIGVTDDGVVNDELNPQMEELGRKMVKHCKGLPLAIVALGGILSTKRTISEWEDIKKNISSYLMDGKEQGGELLKVVELSYFDLPFYLKPCFLYLGSFPEDHQISAQRLYHLWEAEGLLAMEGETQENERTSYDIGERYLNELVQRSMVQVGKFWTSGKIKSCHVHDIMRDMCLKKCKEVCFLRYIECTRSDVASTLPAFSNEINKLRRCAVYDENGDFLDTQFRNGERVTGLRSLLIFRNVGTTLQKIWRAFPLLRVLDLEGSDIYSIDGVENLIHLRYLSLRKSKVGVLPSGLYDLKYLETLDLRCYVDRLKNELYKMKRLRHLYLPRKFYVQSDEKLMFPAARQIETIKNFDPRRCDFKELMEMKNLRVFSLNISRWDYCYIENMNAKEWKWLLKAPMISKEGQLINCLRLLKIKGYVIKEDPEILSCAARNSCFQELVVEGQLRLEDRNMGNANATTVNDCSTLFSGRLIRLELKDCEIGEADMLALEKLLYLEYLLLGGPIVLGARGSNILIFSPGSFPQLRELHLIYWRAEWEELEVGEGALPNLQCLKLNGFSKLKKVENMPNSLTEVELHKCEIGAGGDVLLLALGKLTRLQKLVISPQERSSNKLSLSPNSFLHLTQLTIYFPDELEWEWEIGDEALPNLKSLELWRCKKNMLKNIPNSLTCVALYLCEIGEGLLLSALEKHSRLQQLEIYSGVVAGNKMSFSPGSFPHLTQLLLEFVFEVEWVQEVGDGAFPNLQVLELRKFSKLKNIPNSLTQVELKQCTIGEEGLLLSTLENHPRLEQLKIFGSISVGNKMISFSPSSFPQLTQLHLEYITELERWKIGERALPTLQSLELTSCWKLKKIEIGDGALPTLQHLKLSYCEKLKKLPQGLPDSIHIECEDPCIKGIENYNTCPHFKKEAQEKSSWQSKPKRWLYNSCA